MSPSPPPTGQPFRVGIIGPGWVSADRHIPCFQIVPGVEVVAVLDRKTARARAVAERFGIGVSTDDLDRFFDAPMDAVAIATPPWSHCELSVRALSAGLHVFCEKPMAMDPAEARQMVEASDAAGRILTISHNFTYSRAAQRARRFLGGAAPVHASAVQLSNPARRLPEWYRDLPTGLLYDECPHLLYTLSRFCGCLELVGAHATWADDIEPATVDLTFAGDTPARATMVLRAPVSEWHVTLVAPHGVVDMDLFRDITMTVGNDHAHEAGDILRTSARAVAGHAWGFATSGALMTRGKLKFGHDETISRFVAACRGEGPNPVPTGEALDVVRLTFEMLDAIRR